MNLLENILHNTVLMSVLIAARWIIPGFIFTRIKTQEIKRRELARTVKRVSKFYLQVGPD